MANRPSASALTSDLSPTASRPVAVPAPAWMPVNLPWRCHDSEAFAALDRLSGEYAAWFEDEVEGKVPAPPSVDDWESARLCRAHDILDERTASLQDTLGPTWGEGSRLLDWGSEEDFAALCAACADPDALVMAERRRHRAILDRIEATSPACADWLRRIEEARDRCRSEQFVTHPMCQPGVALQIRAPDGTVRRVLIGDCDRGGMDLASPVIADDDVVLAIMDLRATYL